MKRNVSLLSVVVMVMLVLPLAGHTQWVQTNGPNGADVNCLAAVGGYLYTAMKWTDSNHSGIYYSTDNGIQWSYSDSGLPRNDFVSAIATMGPNLFAAYWGGGIYYSSNRGQTWNPPASEIQTEFTSSLFAFGTHLFAEGGLHEGLLRSDDSGRHWNLLNDSLTVNSFAARGDTLYVGTRSGIFTTTDLGNSWNNKSSAASITSLVLKDSIFYAAAGSEIFRSTDYGENWTPDDSPGGSNIQGLAMVNDVLYAALPTIGIFRKMLPVGWKQINDGLLDRNITVLVSSGSTLFAGTEYTGIHRLDSGTSNWVEVNSGLPISASVYSFASVGHRILAGQDGVLSFSDDKGSHWQETSIIGAAGQFARLGKYLFAVSSDSGVCRSEDSGATWVAENHGLSYEGYSLAENGTTLMAGTIYYVYASTDTGANWTSTDASESLLGSHGSDFFTGEFSSGQMYRSTDNGASWPEITPPDWIPLGGDVIFPMAYTASNTAIFVSKDCDDSGGQIFRSYDNGSNWTQVMRTPSHVNVLYSGDGIVLAGMYGSLVLSLDNGESWSEVGPGLPQQPILSVAICDSEVYVGVDWDGVWRRPLSEVIALSSVAQSQITSPEIQSYPNPFSQSTTITFTPEAEGYADVRVVNLLGVDVGHLFSGDLSAGEHRFMWSNPTGLPAGMYECILRMNGNVRQLPLLLTK